MFHNILNLLKQFYNKIHYKKDKQAQDEEIDEEITEEIDEEIIEEITKVIDIGKPSPFSKGE